MNNLQKILILAACNGGSTEKQEQASTASGANSDVSQRTMTTILGSCFMMIWLDAA